VRAVRRNDHAKEAHLRYCYLLRERKEKRIRLSSPGKKTDLPRETAIPLHGRGKEGLRPDREKNTRHAVPGCPRKRGTHWTGPSKKGRLTYFHCRKRKKNLGHLERKGEKNRACATVPQRWHAERGIRLLQAPGVEGGSLLLHIFSGGGKRG